MAYPCGKSSSGVTASGLCIDSAVPGEVDQGKKNISQFPGKGRPATLGLDQFPQLFPNLGGDTAGRVRPVKTDPCGPFLQVLGEEKGGEMMGDPVQGAFPAGFFLLLELMPSLENLGGSGNPLFAKHVGVSANQFFRKFPGDGFQVEGSALFGQLGMENDMEQDIPEFLPEGVVVPFIDRLEEFVDLFQNHGAERSMGLLSVPRAAFRATKASDDFFERANFLHLSEIREWKAFVES